MNRPTWVTVVAVMGIVFSCWSLVSSGSMMMMPKFMDMQKKMMQTMENDASSARMPESSRTMFKEMMDFPPWFATWSVVAGILRLLISGCGLYASVIMMQLKPHAVRYFYLAVGASVVFTVVNTAVAVTALSFIGYWYAFVGFGGVVIDMVMIIVTAVNDKSAFQQSGSAAATELAV